MQRGRRGFLSGISKMGAMGGAAVLLPREAMAELSGDARRVADEVFIEDAAEVGPEELAHLLGRIRELEAALRGPSFFQGMRGEQGEPGPQGLMGIPTEASAKFTAQEVGNFCQLVYRKPDSDGYLESVEVSLPSVSWNQMLEHSLHDLVLRTAKLEADTLVRVGEHWAIAVSTEAERVQVKQVLKDTMPHPANNYRVVNLGFAESFAGTSFTGAVLVPGEVPVDQHRHDSLISRCFRGHGDPYKPPNELTQALQGRGLYWNTPYYMNMGSIS